MPRVGRGRRRISATGRASGFTLLEMLVVLSILVLVTSLFPWAWNRMVPARRVAVTTERISAAVRDAQVKSAWIGVPVRPRVKDHALAASSVSGPAELTALPASIQVRLNDPLGRELDELVVFPDGSARAGQFEIEDQLGHHYSVSVSGLTGRVIVHREG
jgi:prepilin-type N-terminal cleavage/methylation domain-containing protein